MPTNTLLPIKSNSSSLRVEILLLVSLATETVEVFFGGTEKACRGAHLAITIAFLDSLCFATYLQIQFHFQCEDLEGKGFQFPQLFLFRYTMQSSFSATLSVRGGKEAVSFYERAFDAAILHWVEDPSGAIVAKFSIKGAEFWVADESPEHQNFSPTTLGGSTARLLLIVPNPDQVFATALAAGSSEVFPVGEQHGWRIGRLLDPFGHHWEIGFKTTC